MKSIASHFTLLCGWALLATPCQAQYPGQFGGGQFGGGQFGGGQFGRPAVSPYLNLNRGGDPAINYYGLVRPQLAYNRALQNIGSDINFLETSAAAANQQPAQTGHGASFMTQSQYFMNNGYGGRMGIGSRSSQQGTQVGGQQRTPAAGSR